MISITVIDFCNKYKIPIGATIVIDDEYQDGEIVLVDLGGNFILAEFQTEKVIDIANEKEYILDGKIKIIGKSYSLLKRF